MPEVVERPTDVYFNAILSLVGVRIGTMPFTNYFNRIKKNWYSLQDFYEKEKKFFDEQKTQDNLELWSPYVIQERIIELVRPYNFSFGHNEENIRNNYNHHCDISLGHICFILQNKDADLGPLEEVLERMDFPEISQRVIELKPDKNYHIERILEFDQAVKQNYPFKPVERKVA